MDSYAITKFVEEAYPERPVVLSSPLGEEIEKKARGVLGKAMSTCLFPSPWSLFSAIRYSMIQTSGLSSTNKPMLTLSRNIHSSP